jgi:hypothetical protein
MSTLPVVLSLLGLRRKSAKHTPMPNSFTTDEAQEGYRDLSLEREDPFIWRTSRRDPFGRIQGLS